jgi:fructose-1,6-bisphosphatase/inositol monophosphatase family enzyme
MAISKEKWRKTLYAVVENIREQVLIVLPRRKAMSTQSFKDLLDSVAQSAIVNSLTSMRQSVRLISEEGDLTINGGRFVIVADPVDGTTNLARGLPPAVASLSVSDAQNQSSVFAGIVMNLYTGEVYYAEKGLGASLNFEPIHVAPTENYPESLISMDISKKPRLEKVKELIEQSQHIRMEGCSAMSLCHIASGSLDAHIDVRGLVRATDISAGLLILKEAQGFYMVNGEINGEMSLKRDTHVNLIASSSVELLQEIMRLIK